MKGKIFGVLAVMTALLAASCGGSDGADAQSSDSLSTIEFLQPLPKSIPYYPLFVGNRLGYFEDEGVRVELLPSGDQPATTVISAGNADIGATTPINIVAGLGSGSGADYEVIYEYYQKNVFSIVTTSDSGVKNVADLEGKTIGITSEAAGDADLARSALQDVGLEPGTDTNVAVVGEGGATVISALLDGRINAYTGAINDMVALRAEGIELTDITPEGFDSIPASTMIMQPSVADDMAPEVEGFLRGWAKATYAGMVDPEIVLAMAQEELPEQTMDEDFARILLEQSVELQEPAKGIDRFGGLRPESWSALQDQLESVGQLPSFVDPSSFLASRFIDAANEWQRDEVEADVAEWREANM